MLTLRPCVLVAARTAEKTMLLWNATRFVIPLWFVAGFNSSRLKSVTRRGICNALTLLSMLFPTASGSALIVKMILVRQ
jgi:hypothetical protein